jgi:hypothetical protein
MPGQAGLPRNLGDACCLLAQHGADLHELFPREARLAPEVGPLVVLALSKVKLLMKVRHATHMQIKLSRNVSR